MISRAVPLPVGPQCSKSYIILEKLARSLENVLEESVVP